MPILLYGLEVLPLNKSQLSSLDFVANRFCMKLFKTSDMQTLEFYRTHFNYELPSNMLIRRYKQFLDNATAKTDLVKYFCWISYAKELLHVFLRTMNGIVLTLLDALEVLGGEKEHSA